MTFFLFLLFQVAVNAGPAVQVSWNPVPDATYNIYRTSIGVPVQKLNVQPLTMNRFIDYTARPGTSYAYNVKAVKDGIESNPSNTVTASIPITVGLPITGDVFIYLKPGQRVQNVQVSRRKTNTSSNLPITVNRDTSVQVGK